MLIITDSGFVYALYNTLDKRHREAMGFATQYTGGTVIPDVIVPEVSYLFSRDLGYAGVQKFLEHFSQINARFEPIEKADLARIHELSVAYGDAEFDVVDCCIMVLAERLSIRQIATFDRRDFSIFRPRHCEYLELLP